MFIFYGWDEKDALDVRMSCREAHLQWLHALKDHVKLAGPMLDKNGQPIGSMLVLDYEDQNELELILAKDPYAQAKLFAKTKISAFLPVITQF